MKNKNKRNSIVKRMIFVFVITMLFPSILISSMYYNVVRMGYKNNLTMHFNTVFEQYASFVGYKLEQYEQLIEVVRTSEDVIELVKNPDLSRMFDLSATYMNTIEHEGDIFRCTLYSKNAPYSSEYSYAYVSDDEWFRESYSKGRYSFWFADKTPGMGVPIISTVYPMYEGGVWGFSEPDGVIKLDLYIDKVIGSNFPKDWQGIVDCIVFFDDGQVIWENGDSAMIKNILANSDAKTLAANKELDDFIRCGQIGNQNVYMLCRMQPEYIKNITMGNHINFLIQLVLVIFLILFVWGFYMKAFSKRINGIIGKIKKIEQLDFSKSIEEDKENDEFSLINDTLDTMSSRLDELIYENYEQKLQVQDTELKMLYFQINPHFLYNVLESISEIAYIEGSEKAADMSQMLGKMFRYITETADNDKVSFGEELKYIRYYLEIQKVRFDDKFTFFVEADESLLKMKILKFSLQPIVENAVKYAFVGSKNGVISVKAYTEGNDLIICVSDNGIGMSESKVRALEERIKNDPENYEDGIGLMNVNNRLVKAYGEEYSMKIVSNENCGTQVILKFKIKENPDV